MSFLLGFAASSAVPTSSTVTHSANWFLEYAWLVPLLPALSFVGILFFGKRMRYKGAELGIAAVALSFLLAVCAGFAWLDHRDNFVLPDDSHAAASLDDHADAAPATSGDSDSHADAAPATPGEDSDSAHGAPSTHGVSYVAVQSSTQWLQSGGVEFSAGILVDGLSVMMLLVVTIVSLLVHIYSTDYVSDDKRYTHFFAFLSLFTAAMLFFVLSDNILQMIVGWELVGVCSFVLIGHWWEEKPNSDAALKAFLTNRVGDVGLIIGMITLFFAAGGGRTFDTSRTFDTIRINEAIVRGEVGHTALVVAAVCLMAAVMSKSGQFILHTWLPDAMAGPTPVSALIHAATMVVAGVFLIARLYPVFFEGMQIGGSSINLMATIGAITLVFGGLLAFVQDDIKKVLAYSTVSQLGYMVMALGVGAWTAAVFHLFTHAFFKANLFLGSGSVAHAVHSFDMKRDMGGMRKFMPKTYVTFIIGSLALAGLFPLAGFWSKDEILVGTGGWGLFGGTGGNGAYTFHLLMGMFGAALTAAYMTRCVYLTFHGEYRGGHDHAHGADGAHEAHGDPQESGPRILVPLYILSGLAIVVGFANLPAGFQLVGDSWTERFGHFVEPTGSSYFPAISHATPSWSLAVVASVVALAGAGVAIYYYFVKVDRLSNETHQSLTELPDGLSNSNGLAGAGHKVLVNKYYLDHLYEGIIVAFTKGPLARAAYWVNQNVIDRTVDKTGETAVLVGRHVYDVVDQGVIDGFVDGSGRVSDATGEELRQINSGKVQNYAAILFAMAAVLAGTFLIIFAL